MDVPIPIAVGDEVKIEYNGRLAQSGADSIYLHYGFGPGDWRSVEDLPMEKNEDGAWAATVLASEAGEFSFCFKDENENWDNNGGQDWSYNIHGDQWY